MSNLSFVAITDRESRLQAYAKAIEDKKVDFNLLGILIDSHVVRGGFTPEDVTYLYTLMSPPVVEPDPEPEV